jgi:hypothetical protein
MFHDGGAPVRLIVADGVARGRDNSKFGGFLAWDPVSPDDPPVAIAGRARASSSRRCARATARSRATVARCEGRAIAWQDRSVLGRRHRVNRTGQLVFLHAQAAVTMAELSTALMMHDLAGVFPRWPEASLVVRGSAGELARVGSYETGFVEHDDNREFWALPNILALSAR